MNETVTLNLINIEKVFGSMDAYRERAAKLLQKAINLGFSTDQLELIYVPSKSEYDFEKLLRKMHQIRKEHGCRWDNEYRCKELWLYRTIKFNGFGIKDQPGFVLMIHGGDRDGLHFDGMRVGEQIEQATEFFAANEGVGFLTPAAYISANIVRVVGGRKMLDSSTFTRFPQYSDSGLIDTADDFYVPGISVRGDGQFRLASSRGFASSSVGVRLAVGE